MLKNIFLLPRDEIRALEIQYSIRNSKEFINMKIS